VKRARLLVPVLLAALLAPAEGAPDERRPHLGYLYAAGGQRGTTVRIEAGGQNLRGARGVRISGEGVTAKLVGRGIPNRPLKSDHLREIARRLRRIVARKTAELAGDRRARARAGRRRPARTKPKAAAGKQAETEKRPEVELPDHPLLRDLEQKSLRELKKVAEYFFDPTRRLQASPQIAEVVMIEVTIAPDAPPGDRELRIVTPRGLTNPVLFRVGLHPEISETEINDFRAERIPSAETPRVVNGQVQVRDVDRFRFEARKGQRLVFAVQARRLVPYMADAVPGWFQATVALHDGEGREVRFADDFRFDPDPVLCFEVPEDGEYELEVRDAIWRGRADFVYRITMGELPFITRMFPIGGRTGAETIAEIGGWNLPERRLRLDTAPGGEGVRRIAWRDATSRSNAVPYAVDELPECTEAEPNDTVASAQAIDPPRIVNGRIDRPGDEDVYRFRGRGGDEIAVEVHGRRLRSPIDSLVVLTDASGRTIGWSDDTEGRRLGLVTHQADSYLLARLPADGDYCVRVSDTQRHGGPEYAYRVRIGRARPEFEVYLTPSAVNLSGGARALVTAHVVRRDGFEGDVELLLRDGGEGFRLEGATIPAGADRVRMTLAPPPRTRRRITPLTVLAKAVAGRRVVVHRAIPSEDVMQAFLWRHLVPAEELLVTVGRSRGPRTPVRVAGKGPVRLPAGGRASVRIEAAGLPQTVDLRFALSDPPPGVAIDGAGLEAGAVTLFFVADAEAAEPGRRENLIVEVHLRYDRRGKDGKPEKDANGRTKKATRFAGYLPAIPVTIEPGER